MDGKRGWSSLYENHTPVCMIFIQPFSVPLPLINEGNLNESDMANYGTILVVDDNPAILTAVRICLAGEFDKVLTLVSPDTLLTVLAQEEVDVVLLDMNFTQGETPDKTACFGFGQSIRSIRPFRWYW